MIVTGPQGFEGGPQASGDLHPGTYRVEMSAPGFEPVDQEVVMAADDQEITVALVAKPAVLQVVITGPDGQPMDAKYSIGKGELADTEGGRVELTLDAGKHLLTVRAEGYAVDKQKLALDRGETELVEIQLRPTQVQLTVEKIEIKGEVFFDVNQATIKAESHPLLEEVAQVMLDHPEVLRLRIEGHTDSRGDAGYNLELSKKRSAAVKDFLIAKGVEEGRLESEGFGESKPLEKGENEAAWSKNRRVDFFIAERTEAKPVKKKAE